MNNLYREVKNIINEYCNGIEDPFLAKVHKTLMEADVRWLNLQVLAVGQLLRNPQTEVFGRENVSGWHNMNNDQKIAKLFGHFDESGALKEMRDYVESSPEVIPTKSKMHYDFIEVEEPYNGNESIHLKQLKNSNVFKDLTQILLKHL